MDMYYITGLISALLVVSIPFLVVIVPIVAVVLLVKFFKYLWIFTSSIGKKE